jgi:hypothetical protein
VVNPEYFEYADRRIRHLVDNGIMPAIVGAWGRGRLRRHGVIGVAGLKRHWRHLVARYGAYPVCWMLGGEIPEEHEVGRGALGGGGPPSCARSIRSATRSPAHTGNGRRGHGRR